MSFRWLTNYFVPSHDNSYRPHLLRRPWLLFFLAVIFGAEGFLVANLVARQSSANFLAAVVPAEIVALTNSERSSLQVGSLKENKLLDAAAQAKATDMAANSYFSHKGPDGKTPWQWISGAGYKFQWAGENLAVRFIDSKDVVHAWMASPTHRANIVKPVYTEIGVGVAQGMFQGSPATYVVQYFGAPIESAAAVASAPTNSFTQSLTRQLVRFFGEPQQTSNTILGVVAFILISALILTFFMHLQLQHTHLLAQTLVVAGIAVLFLLLNISLSAVGSSGGNQAAAVAQTTRTLQPVLIDAGAESTGYTLFP